MIFAVVSLVFGALCVAYDAIIICLCPGTFLDNVFAFSHIWSVLGGYHVFLGIYRLKKGKSFYSTWSRSVKTIVMSLCGAAVLISAVTLCFIASPKVSELSQECDYVILLGGGIDKNGKLPVPVQKRVDKAAEYLLLHPDCICVVTGGTLMWLPYPEAPAIKQDLIEKGIPADRILIEDQALDTIQNFELSCQLLAEYEGVSVNQILQSQIAVVSSKYHLRRAERLAARMGFEHIYGIPAKVGYVTVVHSYVREICAYLKLNIRVFLTGKPSKLSC